MRFIDDFNSINDNREFESNYCNIYPEELELGKKNTDMHEASSLDLDIKMRHRKFQVGLFDKRDWFVFSIEQNEDLSPSGSRPGIMYGLAKVHKIATDGFLSFRTILAAIGTPTYKLTVLTSNARTPNN